MRPGCRKIRSESLRDQNESCGRWVRTDRLKREERREWRGTELKGCARLTLRKSRASDAAHITSPSAVLPDDLPSNQQQAVAYCKEVHRRDDMGMLKEFTVAVAAAGGT